MCIRDRLRIPVDRPKMVETTAFGAAALAGLAVGYWDSLEDVRRNWAEDKVFEPIMPADRSEALLKGWHRAVKCALDWTKE